MNDISIITVSLPEERLEYADTKTLRTGEPYAYGRDLGNRIIGALLGEDLIQAGHIEDTTYTTQYKYGNDDAIVKRQEREMRLKVSTERLEQNKDRIVQIIDGLHPYYEIPMAATKQKALRRSYAQWANGQQPEPSGS